MVLLLSSLHVVLALSKVSAAVTSCSEISDSTRRESCEARLRSCEGETGPDRQLCRDGILRSFDPDTGTSPSGSGGSVTHTTATCEDDQKKTFLGIFPTWYKYVDDYGPVNAQGSRFGCGFNGHQDGDLTKPKLPEEGRTRTHAVQIGLAIIDILIRLGAVIAVVYFMMGGYQYMSSMGDPNATKGAMSTLINAAIGLAITVTAVAIVSFIGARLGG